jgi:ectoine hydroxylase-related dioxygenase (phytanoyl-CoA dioxygenase family)
MEQRILQSYRDQYRDRGYFVVPDLLDETEIQRFRDATDALIERSRKLTGSDEIFDLEPGHTSEQPRIRRIKAPHRVDPVFDEFMQHPALLSVLTAILGPDIRHQYVKLNSKAADGGVPLEWHQDWAFYPHTNDSVLAVGLMIDDVGPDNGPTLIIPGSHRPRRVLDHHRDGVFVGAIDPDRAGLDFDQAVPVTGSAGTIYVFDAFIVHGAARNTSPRMRRNCFYEFMASDAWPLEGIHGEDMKIVLGPIESRGVAGQAVVTPRLAEVPVRLPLPRPAGQRYGSIYEIQQAMPNRFFA